LVSGNSAKNLARLSRQLIASADRRFKFHKRSQLFIRTHNETLSVAARQLMFGTTLMGADRTRSVVDADSRSHDHLNLFIVGSSVFPTASTADPMLTLAALALRTAEKIKNELAAA